MVLLSKEHTFPASPTATSRSSGSGKADGTLELSKLNPLRWVSRFPSPDKRSGLDRPRSFPIPSSVYGSLGPPAVALLSLWFLEAGGSVSRSCSTLRTVGADLKDLEAPGAGDRRVPPPPGRVGVGRRERDSAWERRQGGSCSAVRGACACAKLARRLLVQSAIFGAWDTGPQGLESRSSAPHPSLWSSECPAVRSSEPKLSGRGAGPGPCSPPPLLVPSLVPSPLSFPEAGAHQWSCLGMHTQLTAGGG